MKTFLQSTHPPLRRWALWDAWVGANAVGELIGLAIPAAVGGLLARELSSASAAANTVGSVLLVLAGVAEGVVVGVAQGFVLRRVFSDFRLKAWVVCTAFGAAVTWTLGMLPNLLIGPVEQSMVSGLGQLNPFWQYAAAAAMGCVLGSVLGLSQWYVLRRYVHHAHWWVPANAVAWMFGMPIVFVAAGSIAPGSSAWSLLGLAGATMVLSGATVGAVHGAVLVWLTRESDRLTNGTQVPRTDSMSGLSGVPLLVFQKLPLRTHALLEGIPLHSLDRLELPGGRPGMILPEISAAIGFNGEAEMEVGRVTRFLFALRGMIGRVLDWDRPKPQFDAESYVHRLTDNDRARSLVKPGSAAGISRIMYEFENELLGEIINRTVHCFWLLATEATRDGYVAWFAVYVRKRNWFTPFYMGAISPLLRTVIYPAMLRGSRKRWMEWNEHRRTGRAVVARESTAEAPAVHAAPSADYHPEEKLN